MNKLILLLVPIILLVTFLLFIKKNVENFQDKPEHDKEDDLNLFNMNPRDSRLFKACKKLRDGLYNKNAKWGDLINPNPVLHPIGEPGNKGTPVDDNLLKDNIKKHCMGDVVDPQNYLMNPNHVKHVAALKKYDNRGDKTNAWSKNPNKFRFAAPVTNIEYSKNQQESDTYTPLMGNINLYSPKIMEKDTGWKWFADGKLQQDNSFNFKNPGIGTSSSVRVRNWKDIHPFIAARANGELKVAGDSKYMDIAQSEVPKISKKNPKNNDQNVEVIMKTWGSEFGNNPDQNYTPENEPFAKPGDDVKYETPLYKIKNGTMAYDGIPADVLAMKAGSCLLTKGKKPGEQVDIAPLQYMYQHYPEKIKANYANKENKFMEEQLSGISSLEDLEKYFYKRKMIPKPGLKNGPYNKQEKDKITLDSVNLYGRPFSEAAQKGFVENKGNKVLAGSGYDATQMRNTSGDLKSVKDQKGNYTVPKIKYPVQIVKEKQCPPAIKHRYYYEKPGLPQYSKWYIGEVGGSFTSKSENKPIMKDEEAHKCTQCSNPGGCKYPNAAGGRYSADYFESQKCGNGKDRVCTKCRICKMGSEIVDTDCGEGGGDTDRTCCVCSACPEGTYKVYGCDKPNSYYDTECKPLSQCYGFGADAKKLEQLQKNPKYKNLNTYDNDPGEGKRSYKIRDGLKGGYEDRNKIDPATGEKLKNPYFGRDTMCGKCDTCPKGWKHLRGCFGVNDDENTICQRTIDKESYLAKNFVCPKGQFYNKAKISDTIDKMNADIQRKDEAIRTQLKAQNEELKKNPEKSASTPPINLNDPKNFPDPLPQLSDDDLIRMGCTTCKVCPGDVSHRDPNAPGCKADMDTNCKPHTPCKDFQYVSKDGDSFNDQQCSSCRCPQPNYYGFPDCAAETTKDADGVNVPKGCERKVDCKKGEYVFSDPGMYGDTTKPRICKKCKKCNYGTFAVEGGCRVGGGTDTVCKNWKKCDKKSMIVIEPGTAESDTICKCLDGFELPKNKVTGKPDLDASHCVPIQGECHKLPCHPKANCFDNFTDNGEYLNTVCECDIDKGFIQTEKKGFGPDGCFAVPGKHNHEIRTPAQSYGELPDKFAKILTHIDDKYHRKKTGTHLHKNAPLKIDDEGVIIS